MNVLVTGATGYLGRAVTRKLGAHSVTNISRSTGVDLGDASATRQALNPWRWDAVVHLAGPAPKSELSWPEAVETVRGHVAPLVHVLAAIPEKWGGRFVLPSGAIVYGNPESLPVTEEHPRRPLHTYALAKCLAEDVLLGSALSDRWCLRMGGLFSADRRSGALFHFIRAAQARDVLRVTTTSPVPWDILHVDDAAEAILRSLESPSRDPRAVNIGYGEPIHLIEMAERLARRGNAKVAVEGISPPVFQGDVAKARALLAWAPPSLAERIDELWSAFSS